MTNERHTRARKPRTVSECPGKAPGAEHVACPWVSCRQHLAGFTLSKSGKRRPSESACVVNSLSGGVPDIDLSGSVATCALDVASEDGATLERIGKVLGVSRERVRQIEEGAKRRLRARSTPEMLEFLGLDPADAVRFHKPKGPLIYDLADYSALTPWRDLPRGFRARRIRHRLGWSAVELCELLKASRSVLYKVERGEWATLSPNALPRFMIAMGVRMRALDSLTSPSLARARRPGGEPTRSSSDLRLDWLIDKGARLPFKFLLERERLTRRLSTKAMADAMGLPFKTYVKIEDGVVTPKRAERSTLTAMIRERLS